MQSGSSIFGYKTGDLLKPPAACVSSTRFIGVHEHGPSNLAVKEDVHSNDIHHVARSAAMGLGPQHKSDLPLSLA